MEIIAGPLDWTQIDEENLSKFLDTETGKRFIPHLAEATPALLDKGHVNSILIRSGEVRGFQHVLREILVMAHPSAPIVPKETGEYPSLEDDSAWNDGQKLVQQPKTQ